MQVVQPTTASQIFHVLRRQMVRNLRKPLVIMTPKSLLRNKDATSPLSEFTKGSFQTVIPESKDLKADKVKRVVACSGKVYYDLAKKREEKGTDDVAIIRVEQLYPFPHKAFAAELKKYPNVTDIVWCQDEPQNQGAWFFVQHYIHENMPKARSWVTPAAPPRHRRRWATRTCTRSSRRRWSTAPSASSRASS
jgi:2-oxoglutarate dehydrogenase E1 component